MTRDEAITIFEQSVEAYQVTYSGVANAINIDLVEKIATAKPTATEAAATVIQQAFAERDGEIERLREALRDMADAVAVYSQQPVEATRQRPQIHQDQWDQIAMICGDMLRQALAAKGDSRG